MPTYCSAHWDWRIIQDHSFIELMTSILFKNKLARSSIGTYNIFHTLPHQITMSVTKESGLLVASAAENAINHYYHDACSWYYQHIFPFDDKVGDFIFHVIGKMSEDSIFKAISETYIWLSFSIDLFQKLNIPTLQNNTTTTHSYQYFCIEI